MERALYGGWQIEEFGADAHAAITEAVKVRSQVTGMYDLQAGRFL